MMKILVIIQRSNGDVFLTSPLIRKLHEHYNSPTIDMLVNDDTLAIAKTLPHISNYIVFSYDRKKKSFFSRLHQEREIIGKIWRHYDLAINLTASDRSVQYAIMASQKSISAIESDNAKSWWKKLFLTKHYVFNSQCHIVQNNMQPLGLLGIEYGEILIEPAIDQAVVANMKSKLDALGVGEFFIFHASAQYEYKIYPEHLRNELLQQLANHNIQLVMTGGKTTIDITISEQLPNLDNIYNFIGKTSLEELIALVYLSKGYIGMDTLVMHIAAGFNKPIFAVFGPTLTSMWRPWQNNPHQYVKLFQASMPCVPCGKAGCDDKHGKSECLYAIHPERIVSEVVQSEK